MGSATSKLMRGLLEALLLDAIAREPKHGYALIRELEQVFGAPPNRNQVYPLLNRLEKDGYLRADRAEGRGKTRYALTGKGLELLKEYRLRPPEFSRRILALWAPGEGATPAAGAAEPGEMPPPPAPPRVAEDRGPHLLDRLALPGEAPAPAGAGHAGQPCSAEVALRRQPGRDRVAVEVAGLDPACPTCGELARWVRAVRDRWF